MVQSLVFYEAYMLSYLLVVPAPVQPVVLCAAREEDVDPGCGEAAPPVDTLILTLVPKVILAYITKVRYTP